MSWLGFSLIYFEVNSILYKCVLNNVKKFFIFKVFLLFLQLTFKDEKYWTRFQKETYRFLCKNFYIKFYNNWLCVGDVDFNFLFSVIDEIWFFPLCFLIFYKFIVTRPLLKLMVLSLFVVVNNGCEKAINLELR